MEQMPKSTVMADLIRLFGQGVICVAEFWRAVESEIRPAELTEVFATLSASEQDLLRDLFHERPLSLRATESRAFRRQLRKWMIAGQNRMPASQNVCLFSRMSNDFESPG